MANPTHPGKHNLFFLPLVLLALLHIAVGQETPLECQHICSNARNGFGYAKAGACAKESKTMPRPLIGNACGAGFEAGFDDACEASCKGENAQKAQGLACKDYRNQLPKPTTMRACGAGYDKGFSHAKKEMAAARAAAAAVETHTHLQEEAAAEAAIEKFESEAATEAREELAHAEEPAAEPEPAAPEEPEPAAAEPAGEAVPNVLFAMNVTVDEKPILLEVYENDDPEEAVTAFCALHMAGAGESCGKQLLPHVTSKIEAAISSGSVTL